MSYSYRERKNSAAKKTLPNSKVKKIKKGTTTKTTAKPEE